MLIPSNPNKYANPRKLILLSLILIYIDVCRFYRAFKKSKIESLESFYREYQPPITPCHYTCVGLAYELIHRLNTFLPENHDAVNKFYVVSCEEVELETAYLN